MMATYYCSQFLELFCVDLFLNESNYTPIFLLDSFQSERYDMYTRKELQEMKIQKKPICGDLTPHLFIHMKQLPGDATSSANGCKIAVDATITENSDRAFKEKSDKYSTIADHFIMISCNSNGEKLRYRCDTQLPIELENLFHLRFGKKSKILKKKTVQQPIFEHEYKKLQAELDYWAECRRVGHIIKSTDQ